MGRLLRALLCGLLVLLILIVGALVAIPQPIVEVVAKLLEDVHVVARVVIASTDTAIARLLARTSLLTLQVGNAPL